MAESVSPQAGMNPNFDLDRDILHPAEAALTPTDEIGDDILPLAVEAANRLRSELYVDPKTGLENDRGFHETLAKTIENLQPGDELTVSLYDIDDFKKWNEQLGHLEADDLLGLVGAAFGKVFTRKTDAWDSARLQGDEFVTSIIRSSEQNKRRHNTAFEEAEIQAKRLNELLPELLNGTKFQGLPIQLTHGSVSYRPGDTPRDLLIKADIQMLSNKIDKKGGQLSGEDIAWIRDNRGQIAKLMRVPDWMAPFINDVEQEEPQSPSGHQPTP